ncbi:MAG: hypothetical protein ACRDI2_17425 [Chloroflexota bacterium]
MSIKRMFAGGTFAALLALAPLGAAQAAIHPIVSSACAARLSQTGAGQLQDPPGQTPVSMNPADFDQSDLRALLATGVIAIDPATGMVRFDPANPALNGNSGEQFCKLLRT